MPCPVIQTGAQFVSATLFSIDCHARAIGGYGYSALADPASPVLLALTSLVTIFIALFGIRLLLGPAPGARDLVGDIIRIGLVLTIATSWPAWRAVAYDLVFDGPVEIAQSIGTRAGLPGSANAMITRLQSVDDGLVVVTMYGSGRLTGGVSGGADLGDAPSGIALADDFALGIGRTAFLVSTIGSFAIVRLCAGVLLAIAPLMAGLALFTGTFGVFMGWLRGLAFCALGSIMLLITHGAMTAMLFPWVDSVLKLRKDNVLVPSAPTEMLALMLGFAVLTCGALFLAAKLAFYPVLGRSERAADLDARKRDLPMKERQVSPFERPVEAQPSRAQVTASSVAASVRREETIEASRQISARLVNPQSQPPLAEATGPQSSPRQLLGDSFRRNHRRTSVAAGRRNQVG